MSDKAIKQAQAKAKELGHCLCHLKQTCPCDEYVKNKKCKCSEAYVD